MKTEMEIRRLLQEAEQCKTELISKRSGNFNNATIHPSSYEDEFKDMEQLIADLKAWLHAHGYEIKKV